MKTKHSTEFMHLNKILIYYYLSNSKNSYYFLMKDFESFMTNKTKHRGKKVFVDIV